MNVLVSNESEWTIRSCNFILRLAIYYYNCYPVLVGVETVFVILVFLIIVLMIQSMRKMKSQQPLSLALIENQP